MVRRECEDGSRGSALLISSKTMTTAKKKKKKTRKRIKTFLISFLNNQIKNAKTQNQKFFLIIFELIEQ